jgi:hypothetical protein
MSMDVKGELTPNEASWHELHPKQQSQSNALKPIVTSPMSDEGGLDLDRIWKGIQRRYVRRSCGAGLDPLHMKAASTF